jgi:hypothetical protein
MQSTDKQSVGNKQPTCYPCAYSTVHKVLYLILHYFTYSLQYPTLLYGALCHNLSLATQVFHVLTSNSEHTHCHRKNTTDSIEENPFLQSHELPTWPKLLACYQMQKFTAKFTKPMTGPPWSQTNLVLILPSYFLKTYFNIFCPSTPMSPKWFLSSSSPTKFCIHFSVTWLIHPILLDCTTHRPNIVHCICIHVCMHTKHTHTHTYIYIYIYIYTHTHIYVCVCA